VIARQYWDWLPVGVEGEQTLSVLFCASWRKKEPKNAVGKVSRLRARLGALPQDPSRFLKKATQKLS
jgi:hypothetical protein